MKALSKVMFGLVLGLGLVCSVSAQTRVEAGQWYVSPGVGIIIFERSQPAHAGALGMIRVGYDATEEVSFEVGAMYGPRFKKHTRRYDPTFRTTEAWGLSGDVIFHLSPRAEVDPYLSVGMMYMRSPQGMFVRENNHMYAPRIGGGVLVHLADNLSLRANANLAFSIYQNRMEFTPLLDLGVNYSFGG